MQYYLLLNFMKHKKKIEPIKLIEYDGREEEYLQV